MAKRDLKGNWRESCLRLHPRVALKRLELPYLYHIDRDELYELEDRSIDFLAKCDGSSRGADLTADEKFIRFCMKEGLLETLPEPDPIPVSVAMSPMPSLRYLELQLTRRCNLKCRHCYLGSSRTEDLPLRSALKIALEFSKNGGMRLLISGGEPLLYPHVQEFIAGTAGLPVRRILLTNGTLITRKNIAQLHVEEIQFSLDGWQKGHDMLRGKGAFYRTMRGLHAAHDSGIPISIATMIHQGNRNEFDQLRILIKEIGAIEWGIDVLCVAGSLKQHRDLLVPYRQAALLMNYAFGGGYHGSSEDFACGRHLMTVMPDGRAVKCGFYEDAPLGDARKGLIACWLKLKHIPTDALECKGCLVIKDCAGGCRFRAPHPLAPDPVMCALYRVKCNSLISHS